MRPLPLRAGVGERRPARHPRRRRHLPRGGVDRLEMFKQDWPISMGTSRCCSLAWIAVSLPNCHCAPVPIDLTLILPPSLSTRPSCMGGIRTRQVFARGSAAGELAIL